VWQLVLGLTRPRGRILSLGFSALAAMIVAGYTPICVQRHSAVIHRAFLERRIQWYSSMAAIITTNRAHLTQKYEDVSRSVGRSGVYARTNADGSLSIRFHGLVDGGWLDYQRVGYFYHTGSMVPKPGKSNYYSLPGLRAYDFRLTNGWYKFEL
jgi:hypothetical protein